MQHRENHINGDRLPAIGFLHQQAVVGRYRRKQAGSQGVALLPAAIGDLFQFAGVEEPFALPGDANRQNFVFMAIQLPEDGGNGKLGNIMFGRSAAKQDGNNLFRMRHQENPFPKLRNNTAYHTTFLCGVQLIYLRFPRGGAGQKGKFFIQFSRGSGRPVPIKADLRLAR